MPSSCSIFSHPAFDSFFKERLAKHGYFPSQITQASGTTRQEQQNSPSSWMTWAPRSPATMTGSTSLTHYNNTTKSQWTKRANSTVRWNLTQMGLRQASALLTSACQHTGTGTSIWTKHAPSSHTQNQSNHRTHHQNTVPGTHRYNKEPTPKSLPPNQNNQNEQKKNSNKSWDHSLTKDIFLIIIFFFLIA